MGSMRFKGLTLRSKSVAGGLSAPKLSGDGSRNKVRDSQLLLAIRKEA
jgi:hypothetical protein